MTNVIAKTIVPAATTAATPTLASLEFSGPYFYIADGGVHCYWKSTLPYHIHADHTPEAWAVLKAAEAAGEVVIAPWVEPEPVEVVLTILEQIQALDRQITKRRLREAMLTEEGKQWLIDIEAQITALRAQL